MKAAIELNEAEILEAIKAHLLHKGFVAKTGQLRAAATLDRYDNQIGYSFSAVLDVESVAATGGSVGGIPR